MCEAHLLVDRSEQFTRIASDILSRKGWTMINAYDLSAAFTFDTATGNDGLRTRVPMHACM